MNTVPAFEGFDCLACGESVPDHHRNRCPDCGGPLDCVYDSEMVSAPADSAGSDTAGDGTGLSAHPLLPFSRDTQVSLGAGETPLLDAPTLATRLNVGAVLVKDEAHNPTGGLVDRELALAVTAARERGADRIVLPSTGNGGQAAAACAARAGLDSTVYVPSRASFQNKAMINVYGGEMQVVGGRYGDAVEAYTASETETATDTTAPVGPFATPFRHEAVRAVAVELVAALQAAPDVVVHPTGHGTGIVGLHRGFRDLADTGVIDDCPRLYAAQPAGCAPIVAAWEAWMGGTSPATGRPAVDPVEQPDTICGSLEIPDPAGGPHVLDALFTSGGGAVAVSDDELLDAALSATRDGLPVSATGGVAVSGAAALADRGVLGQDDTVVLVDPVTANREADILRSRLMSEGV